MSRYEILQYGTVSNKIPRYTVTTVFSGVFQRIYNINIYFLIPGPIKKERWASYEHFAFVKNIYTVKYRDIPWYTVKYRDHIPRYTVTIYRDIPWPYTAIIPWPYRELGNLTVSIRWLFLPRYYGITVYRDIPSVCVCVCVCVSVTPTVLTSL